MVNKLKDTSAFVSAGEQIANGVGTGIDNKAPGLLEKAGGLANRIASRIRTALDIHSPSRVMMGIGEMIDRGLALGIENFADLPINEAQSMVEDIIDTGDDFDDFEVPIEGTGYAEPVVINMTINGAAGQDVEELANIVSERISDQLARRRAVYA